MKQVGNANRTTLAPRPTPAPTQFGLPLEDIQAGIVRGYPNATCASHLLISLAAPDFRHRLVRAFDVTHKHSRGLPTTAEHYENHLHRLRGNPAPTDGNSDDSNSDDSIADGNVADGNDLKSTVTVGFTYSGLKRLGVAFELLGRLPVEFREGMAGRAAGLGDVGESAPATWLLPHWAAVDAIVIIHARTEEALNNQVDEILTELRPLVITEQRSARREGNTEPFGYRDGISNPVVQGSGVDVRPGNGVMQADRWTELAAGEVLLGHMDRNGHPSGHTRALSLLRNGSYLVWRKLEQDVDGYNELIQQVATSLGVPISDAEAVVMGRYKDGAPLAHSFDSAGGPNTGDSATANSFTYLDDPAGARTPRTSHVRRANPRLGIPFGRTLSDSHRIVRRGMPYRDDDGTVGLIFQCYQSDIARQFEFIQCRWLNDGDAFGLGSEPDAVAGTRPEPDAAAPSSPCPWSAQEAHVLRPGPGTEPIEVKRVVRTRGGAYFFVPGISALIDLLGDPKR